MPTLIEVLSAYGQTGVQALKNDVSKISATHETENSIRFEVTQIDEVTSLSYYGRQFFSTLETGRGPRKSDTDSGFKDYMLKYMRARGIGADLSEKKRQQLAKFLVLRINREGDETFKAGGRVVYTPTVDKLVTELKQATKQVLVKQYTKFFISGFNNT